MKQTDRVPHMARGADEKRAGVPAERAGAPAESAGVPAERAGVPAESAGTTKTSYPLMKYLSLLLAVALLFSGVTFARYLSNDQIDASVGIAAFDATYSIDRVNSTTFGNQDYWIPVGGTWVPQGAGTAITVGMTLKNNGDTSVMPTLHFEGPKEYWDHIALQLTTTRNVTPGDVAAGVVLTPQLVIGSIFGKNGEIKTGTDGENQTGTDGENQTGSSDYGDYGSLGGDAILEVKSVTDGDKTTTTTATWTDDGHQNKMTITSSTRNEEYAVGFVRQSGDDLLPPIFVDCKKEMTFYSIDLELPALDVEAKTEGGTGEQRVVVWLTWTNDAPNNSQAANENFWEKLAIANSEFRLNEVDGNENQPDITILGYHFDVSGVPVTDKNGEPVTDKNGVPTGETTTVRVKNTFGEDEGGSGTTEYFHVASINDNDGAYTHAFGNIVTAGGKTIAQCLNKDESARMYVDLTQFVSKDYQVTDAISVSTIRWETDSQTSFQYAPIQQRAFGVSFRATFVQSSEAP